jgi:hypothetical protein
MNILNQTLYCNKNQCITFIVGCLTEICIILLKTGKPPNRRNSKREDFPAFEAGFYNFAGKGVNGIFAPVLTNY